MPNERPTVLASVYPYKHVCNLNGCHTEWTVYEAHAEEHERLVAAHRNEHRAVAKRPVKS